MKEQTQQPYQNEELLIGRNPINEALSAGRSIIKVMIAKGSASGAAVEIAAKARKAGVPVQEVERKKLDYMTAGAAHQGVVLRFELALMVVMLLHVDGENLKQFCHHSLV